MRSNAERAAECAPTRFSLACRGKPPKNYTKPRPKRKRRPREGPPWEGWDWELESHTDRRNECTAERIVNDVCARSRPKTVCKVVDGEQ